MLSNNMLYDPKDNRMSYNPNSKLLTYATHGRCIGLTRLPKTSGGYSNPAGWGDCFSKSNLDVGDYFLHTFGEEEILFEVTKNYFRKGNPDSTSVYHFESRAIDRASHRLEYWGAYA